MENKLNYQMNRFDMDSAIKGQRVLPANTESFSGVVDESQTDPLLAGDPVKIVSTSAKLPHFAKAAVDDVVVGFVEWNIVSNGSYAAGKICQVSPAGNVMYMEAAGALDAGVAVNINDVDDVTVAKAAAGASVIGWSLESATAAGQLVRVKIAEPVALTANS